MVGAPNGVQEASMGMFDTYNIQWGDGVEGLQTKQLICACASWNIGERVPLTEFSESLHGAWSPESPSALGHGIFQTLIEDWTLERMWHNPGLCERHFSLGHLRGKFADYASLPSAESARSHASELSKIWCDPVTGPLLGARLCLVGERNSRAWASLNGARAKLNATFAHWRENLHAQDPRRHDDSSRFARFYLGPDFSGINRSAVEGAYAAMEPLWRESCLDFESPIIARPPMNRAEEVAMEAAQRPGFGASRRLGAKSIQELAGEGEPSIDIGKASAGDCLSMLKAGHWIAFESAAKRHVANKRFAAEARLFLGRLCASRLGASWALGVASRLPELMPEEVVAAGQPRGLVDWACECLGLPTRQIIPLIELGAACSNTLAHRCLTSSHGRMLPAVLSACGGLLRVAPFNGVSFVEQAISCHSLAALRLAHGAGALPPSSAEGVGLADLAFEIEESEALRSVGSTPSDVFDLESMPDALACALFLVDCGLAASPSARRSPRMQACLALRERIEMSKAALPCHEQGQGSRL